MKWTVKTQNAKRLTESEVPKDNQGNAQVGRMLQILLKLTFTNGTSDISVSTFVDTEEDVKRTIKQNLARLNGQEEAITKVNDGTLDLTDPEPPAPDPVQVAEQEYRDAIALYEELKTKAELDSATYAWGRDNQRVIAQQKLQAWTNLK